MCSCSLLAPQSGAHRIAPYRDFQPNSIQPIPLIAPGTPSTRGTRGTRGTPGTTGTRGIRGTPGTILYITK